MKPPRLLLLLFASTALCRSAEPYPINLETTLRLAGAQNLIIALAKERVREAQNLHAERRQTLLPTLSPSIGYRRHDGNLQDIAGHIFDASKQAGNASVALQGQFDFGEALYQSLAAKQEVHASEADADRVRRETLTTAAIAYAALSRSHATLEVASDAVRLSEELIRQIRAGVDAGLAFEGDLHRAAAQRERNESLRIQAVEENRIASARLAQTLRLPLTTELTPNLQEFFPLALVDSHRSLDSLITSAQNLRPELRSNLAKTDAARRRYDAVTRGPWIPTLSAQAALGGLAGGRNSAWGDADDYQDFGASLSWKIGPGGIGDRHRARTAQSRIRQLELDREYQHDAIAREVIEARARTESLAAQVESTQRELAAAEKLLNLTRDRRTFGVGVVLEAIDAEREFTLVRKSRLRLIFEHNTAQWELWRATGAESLPATRPLPKP